MANQSVLFRPLFNHPHRGPFLTVEWDGVRCLALDRQAHQLADELGADHPQVALVRSWHAVCHGAESFSDELLDVLRMTERVLREHYPEAVRALAMNLSAQGCHTWFLYSHEEAIAPLSAAFHMMLTQDIAVEADVVKVAEVLADCHREVGCFDEAVLVLYLAQPYIAGALEQQEFTVAQYEEFREEFIDEHGDVCSDDTQSMVEALRGPRMQDAFPERVRIDL
jgi:hypothetical protein